MAVAISKIAEAPDYIAGNRRHKIRKLVFSGNYATNGETVTAAQVGLRQIHSVGGAGVAAASTPTTAVIVGTVIATDGLTVAVRSYETGSASAAAFSEKDNAEAYITGQTIRLTFVGV